MAVVVLLFHPDRSLGGVQALAVKLGLHLLHPPALGRLHGPAEHQGLAVGRLGPRGDADVLGKEGIAGADELAAGRGIDAGEIRRDHHMPLGHLAAHLGDLRLAGGQAGDPGPGRVAIAPGNGPVQLGGAGAHHGGEHHVGLGLDDQVHGSRQVLVRGIQRDVDLLQHRAAVLAIQVAHHMVALPGVDVVRADEHHPFPVVTDQVGRQRRAVLVRGRAAVDDVRRILEALVGRRVAEQRVGALHHRHHRLARVGHVAAHQQAYPVVADELIGVQPIAIRVAAGVPRQCLDRQAGHAALAVQLLDGQQGAVALRTLDVGGDAGLGKQQPDLGLVRM
ncbi:hypothetical protein P308_30300 [Pseudomonas piscis]|nr:hypothetical protein P308_30300 [Pseudomonas piscis]